MTPIDHATMTEIDPGELAPDGSLVTAPEEPVAGPSRADRRHPVELTAERLQDHVEQFHGHLTPIEIDALADALEVLDALRVRLDKAARRKARAAE